MVLLWSCLAGPVAIAGSPSMGELEQQLLTYLNERMYNSCKSVVLTQETEDGYEGFVRFADGRRRDVQVTVTAEKIEYRFLGRAYSEAAGRPAADATVPPTQPSPPAAATPDPLYTRQMAARIEKGMSYAQVAGIVGGKGTRISSSYFDGAVNEVWIWANADDSHICVVFRDGVVLVRTQSGLPQASEGTGSPHAEADDFATWLLARRIDGRIVPLDLSFGQWLAKVREAAAKTSGSPQIDVVEENDRIVVELRRDGATPAAGETHLYFTCVPVQDLGDDAPEDAAVERVFIPTGVQADGRQQDDPAQAWELMKALTGPVGM
jgi:hypothetical protein